jgi:hypothetical protein
MNPGIRLLSRVSLKNLLTPNAISIPMVIELTDVLLVEFKDQEGDSGVLIPESELRKLESRMLHGIPVYFRRGAIKVQIGFVTKARKGREAIYGDLRLAIEGIPELKVEEGEVKPLGFVYEK